MRKKTINQFNKFGKDVPMYVRKNEIPKRFVGYGKSKKLKLNFKEEDFVAVYRTKAKTKNMYLLYDLLKVIEKKQMINSITKELLTENQLKKFQYTSREVEKYYYVNGDNSQIFYDKTKKQKNLPEVTTKDRLVGWFIEPILDLLNIPFKDKKPEAMFMDFRIGFPLPLYNMSETPYFNTEIVFKNYYDYDRYFPFTKTEEGKMFLSSEEIDLLNQIHSEKIEKNLPTLVEIAVPYGLKDEVVEYNFYYDVSSHPLFRVKKIMDANFNASIYLNNIMKKKIPHS